MNKILLYIDSMQLGGANRVMSVLAKHFADNGTDVVLVNDIVPDLSVPEYAVPETVKRIFLDCEDRNDFKKNFNRIKKLRRIIKEEKPNVVLSFMGPPNIRMLIAALGLKTRRVASVRNDPNIEYGSGIKKLISCIVMNLAHKVVFQTEDAKKYFFKSTQRKGNVIFNPVNKIFFETEWKQSSKEIAIIGRLQNQKNPMNALRAFEKIASEIPGYTLGFYGDGEMREALEKYVDENSLSQKVIFHGRVGEPQEVLQKAALYVLCSDYEGMPNALMEAMAVGVPCISTDCPCGGPRTLIENESQGVLVPCGDSEKLAKEVLELLFDEQRRVNMSMAARERALCFQPQKVLREWEACLGSA